MEFFEEIAKFRTTRRIYANIMKKDSTPRMLNLGTCDFMCKQAVNPLLQQVDNNVIRVTSQLYGLSLEDVSLCIQTQGMALALPTEESLRWLLEPNK